MAASVSFFPDSNDRRAEISAQIKVWKGYISVTVSLGPSEWAAFFPEFEDGVSVDEQVARVKAAFHNVDVKNVED